MKKQKFDLNPRVYYAIGAIAIAIAFLFAASLPEFAGKTDASSKNTDTQTPIGRHPLTGFPIYENTDFPQVFGVMIDDHFDSWPQAGLDKAFLVFEAPVEAGIPRLLVFFFDDQDVQKIGPVRSARPYFLDWNNELDGLFVHVGGSDAALDKIISGGTFDLNQYWLDQYFWRVLNRYAPHNVYTSTKLLAAYVKNREEAGLVPSRLYETWKFKDAEFGAKTEVESFSVTFDKPTYVIEWKFDEENLRYQRFQNGAAHIMEDGEQIWADNVAMIVTDVKILDSIGRRSVRTIGEGKAILLRDGKRFDGTWEKESESNRIRFYDLAGNEIEFNAGITWVEVVPDETFISFL